MFVNKLLEDARASKLLESITIELPQEINYNSRDLILFNRFLQIWDNSIKYLKKFVGAFTISSTLDSSCHISFFRPILSNQNCLSRFLPENAISIKYEGTEATSLEKLLEFSKDFVKYITIKCPITLSLLTQLGKCKKLIDVSLEGETSLPPGIDGVNIPRIHSSSFFLESLVCSQIPDQTSRIAGIFFSESLRTLCIPFQLLLGSETEIWKSCLNLCDLTIVMKDITITNEDFSHFCNRFICSVNNHSSLKHLFIRFVNPHFKDIIFTHLTKSIEFFEYRNGVLEIFFT